MCIRDRRDNLYLRNAIDLPEKEILAAHARSKEDLLAEVEFRTGLALDPKVLTLGFARRVATYKRSTLLFTDPERLLEIATAAGGMQIIYAGKAHPQDEPGKALIHKVVEDGARFSNSLLRIVYLENYGWDLGALMTAGVDVWLNTPRRPYEASGTSGMKAALNGVPSLSILDGWWIEGCIEGFTGWAIEDGADDAAEANSLYKKPVSYTHLSTIRRIRISRRRSCTWARSAWSAPGRERRRWHCGPRSSFCRQRREGSLRAVWLRGGRRRWNWTGGCGRSSDLRRWRRGRRSSILWCGN